MTISPLRHIFHLALSITLAVFCSGQMNWDLQYDNNGIKIYTSGESGIKTFKAETIVAAPMSACINLLQDIDVQPKFISSVKAVRPIKRLSDTDYFLYYEIDLPFPYKDRDIYTRATFDIENSGAVQCNLVSDPTGFPETDKVRMKEADGFWRFEPINEKQTKITYQFKSDPEGISAWIVNAFVTDGPLATITGFKKWVQKDKYKSSVVSWL